MKNREREAHMTPNGNAIVEGLYFVEYQPSDGDRWALIAADIDAEYIAKRMKHYQKHAARGLLRFGCCDRNGCRIFGQAPCLAEKKGAN